VIGDRRCAGLLFGAERRTCCTLGHECLAAPDLGYCPITADPGPTVAFILAHGEEWRDREAKHLMIGTTRSEVRRWPEPPNSN